MYIKKIEIFSFGCFENKTFEFKRGFNLIYGNNESGKSTLFAFIVYMFYGTKIKKKPGSLSFKEQYMPWNGKPMHGRIVFEYEGCTYVLERLTSHSKSMETLHSLNNGKEIKDREILSSPGEYFFGMSSQSFFSSAFYSAESSGFSIPTTEELITKLTNSVKNVSTEVSYNRITEIINDEILNLTSTRRKNASIPVLEDKIRSKRRELITLCSQNSGSEKLLEENKQLKSEIAKFRNQIENLKKENISLENIRFVSEDRFFSRCLFLVLTILSITMCFCVNFSVFAVLSGLFLVAWLCMEIRQLIKKRAQKDAIHTKIFTMQGNNDKIIVLTEKVSDLEMCIARNDERFNAMQNDIVADETEKEIRILEEQLSRLKKEVEALELAKLAVTNAYNGYKELFVPGFSRISGNIMSELTNGKYTSVLVDDSLSVTVESTFGYKSANSLSRGALCQAGLSLHFALYEAILSPKHLPMFLDDALAFYDEDRVLSTVNYLFSLSDNRQIFFSTCRKNEADILKTKNINSINLII